MSARDFAIGIVQRLRQAGFVAYLAGGCVRDELLGRIPKDYDVATNARPEQVRSLFGERRTLNVGAAFGVVMVRGPLEVGSVEVATFRRDAAYSDGRHPDAVTFSDPIDDARRRDFTINGIFFDPLENRVIDHVGGVEDLRQGIVRAIGNPDERIAEDKLRMLRAVRFAAVFQFHLEHNTLQAIRRHAAEVTQVSAERISSELRLMLAHPGRAIAARLLVQSRLLPVLIPPAAQEYEWNIETGEGNEKWSLILRALERLPAAVDPAVPLALVLREVSVSSTTVHAAQPVDVEDFGKQWRLSNDEVETIRFVHQHEAAIFAVGDRPWSELQRIVASRRAAPLLLYCEALAQAAGQHQASVQFCREKLALPREQLDPAPLLTGNDLKRIGLPAGPLYRQIIDCVRNEQLDGHLHSTEQALQRACEIYEQHSGRRSPPNQT